MAHPANRMIVVQCINKGHWGWLQSLKIVALKYYNNRTVKI